MQTYDFAGMFGVHRQCRRADEFDFFVIHSELTLKNQGELM